MESGYMRPCREHKSGKCFFKSARAECLDSVWDEAIKSPRFTWGLFLGKGDDSAWARRLSCKGLLVAAFHEGERHEAWGKSTLL